ncbi:MAG: hypothetical protein IJ069_02400 [Prevotella sp.]|nr:hypothetical protein [Prevotella sp.]MBQ8152518.1 hypothetical protein [Prevotella sp.]MBQ8716054.1 hypothetical protein [Prevotella sp.]
MKRHVITWLLLAWMTTIHAQRTCVVADMESRKPIRNALIMTDTHHAARTNLYGYFAMKYAFDSATVSHPSFHSTKVKRTALPDTIFLLKKLNLLQEVTIYGVDRQKQSLAFHKESARRAAAGAPRPSSGTVSLTFDFANMLDRRKRHDKKVLKKMEKIFKEMDAMDDPLYIPPKERIDSLNNK